MYCPQCGTESQANVQYCRVCGSNLKVIGKAVSLSEAIARSDRGPLPKLREMMSSLKVDQMTEEVSRALDHMNQELTKVPPKDLPKRKSREERRAWSLRKKKTAAERRENHITKGVVSMFSGVGLTVFLYFLSSTLILKLPPDIVGQIPFEVQSIVRIIWLIGLLPITSGVGHILAGLLIRPDREPQPQLDQVVSPPAELTDRQVTNPIPMSITDHTTNLLDHDRVKS
jgi:zinc-ribbon domain